MQADLLGTFASDAQATAKMSVLHGFAVRAGVATGSQSPAQNQLSVTPGAAILSWRRGTEQPTFGVLAAMDGISVQPQGIDLTTYPSGTYRVWLRMTYTPSGSSNRTFWNAASPGFEYAQLAQTRLSAAWEVQALAQSGNPGADWLPIAKVTWTAPATAGGAGTLSALVDLRPLYFEGRPDAATPYSNTWGTSNDRSADRSTYGVGNLQRFVEAMTTCLEDIKGPGLQRWWDPGIGGINVGFVPNTPKLGRVAVGSAGTYLQGRTAAAPSAAYLVGSQDTGATGFDGFVFGSDRQQWVCKSTYPSPVVTVSQFGTVGFGMLAGTDLFASPGRSLVEIVVTTQGRAGLRIGARALNGAVPCNIDPVMYLVAPDQTGNAAQVLFSVGGVQGPEKLLFGVGKNETNDFILGDRVNSREFLKYKTADQSLQLFSVDFRAVDGGNSQPWLTYFSSTKVAAFTDTVAASTVRGATLVSTGSANIAGSLQAQTASILGTASAGQLNLGSTLFATGGRLQVPTLAVVPANATEGAMFFRVGNSRGDYNRLYVYMPTYCAATNTSPDDGLPAGWKAVAV